MNPRNILTSSRTNTLILSTHTTTTISCSSIKQIACNIIEPTLERCFCFRYICLCQVYVHRLARLLTKLSQREFTYLEVSKYIVKGPRPTICLPNTNTPSSKWKYRSMMLKDILAGNVSFSEQEGYWKNVLLHRYKQITLIIFHSRWTM